MKFIKNYNSHHYTYYFKKIEQLIDKNKDINEWIKSLKDDKLNYWIYVIMSFEKNNTEYYEEISILITIVIRLFILELEIDGDQIKLKNSEIKKLVDKLKHSLYVEYSNRNKISTFVNKEYSLLK